MKGFCIRALVLALAVTGCSSRPSLNTANSPSDHWLLDGMIAISRPLPSVVSAAPESMLGFMPLPKAAHVGIWLSIDRSSKMLTVMDGDKEVSMAAGDGVDKLKTGVYQVLHKQRNALWYAPDSYFTARNLKVPPQGDRARYRRGALGDFVVFINKDTPIYSGPFWVEDVGGIRLSDEDMSRLYYRIDVGSPIEVH